MTTSSNLTQAKSPVPPEPWLDEILDGLTDEQRLQFAAHYYPLRRDKNVALILAVTIGPLGVDRFYTGDIARGVIKLLTFLLLLVAIAVYIPVVARAIATGKFIDMRLYIGLGLLGLFLGILSFVLTAFDICVIMRRVDEVNKVAARHIATWLRQ